MSEANVTLNVIPVGNPSISIPGAEQYNIYTEQALYYRNLAKTAKDWAIKMGSKVIEDEVEIDYSSKYYANQSQNSATIATNAEEACETYKDQCNNYSQQLGQLSSLLGVATTEEAEAGLVDNKVMTPKKVAEAILAQDGIPIGDIVYRPFIKIGYVGALGQEVNRADYPTLEVYADKNDLFVDDNTNTPWMYGRGNGTTTMVLPNYVGRVIWGGTSAALLEAGLLNITGSTGTGKGGYTNPTAITSVSGCFSSSLGSGGAGNGGNWLTSIPSNKTSISFNASLSNSIYGKSTTVQPPAIQLIPQIKY